MQDRCRVAIMVRKGPRPRVLTIALATSIRVPDNRNSRAYTPPTAAADDSCLMMVRTCRARSAQTQFYCGLGMFDDVCSSKFDSVCLDDGTPCAVTRNISECQAHNQLMS